MVLPERSSINLGPNVRPKLRTGPMTLQSLHADFDRGEMKVEAFVRGVQELGYATTPEFHRLVCSSGGSCSIPFAKLVKSLAVGLHDRLQPLVETPQLTRSTTPRLIGQGGSVYDAILDLIRGKKSCYEFRHYLTDKGIPITQDLDRLLRLHESDHAQSYQDFAVILARLGVDVTKPGFPAEPDERRRSGNYGNFLAWHQ
jgi:hypothetical protein